MLGLLRQAGTYYEGHAIEQLLSDKQSAEKEDQNAELGNDATDPPTDKMVMETT